LTDCNGPFLAGKTISPPERLRFQGGDEHEIDGWLIPPVEREVGRKYGRWLDVVLMQRML
jgi:dipeptidyl aminopeptidase/acylaminoacyl peptidase